MPIPHEKAVLGVTQAVQALQAGAMVNPSIGTIRRGTWGNEATMVRDVRDGEWIAAGITLAVGVTLALLIEDMAPVYTSLIAVGIMVAIYEWALATRQPAVPPDHEGVA